MNQINQVNKESRTVDIFLRLERKIKQETGLTLEIMFQATANEIMNVISENIDMFLDVTKEYYRFNDIGKLENLEILLYRNMLDGDNKNVGY